ncbi:type II secretion system protein [Chloroflexota bacterium]
MNDTTGSVNNQVKLKSHPSTGTDGRSIPKTLTMFIIGDHKKDFGIHQLGFTLIELLIVVAILGALAAVVIPNIGRFIGRGETEAKEAEFSSIQSAVHVMMVDNNLGSLPNPVSAAASRKNDMASFPDTSFCGTHKIRDTYGNNFQAFLDKNGYLLYSHDWIADGSNSANLINYVNTQTTVYWYTADELGTITQYDTAP